MLIGFLDDTEIVVDDGDSSPDIFVFGGYFIQHDQLNDLQRQIAEVKSKHGLSNHAPVKWNLRDKSLRDYYASDNLLRPTQVDHLLQVSDPLRRDLLTLLAEFDAKLFVSGRYDVTNRPATHSDYYVWAFENLLQRVGLMVQEMKTSGSHVIGTTLVVDWPQGGVGKRLFDTYYGGYHFGRGLSTNQGYYSGPLHMHCFAETLLHGSTLHSGPLQLADLMVGCCREFLAWAFKGTRIQRINGFFDPLIPLFHRDARGRLNDCGFKVARANDLDIEAKINEYSNLVGPSQPGEIPF